MLQPHLKQHLIHLGTKSVRIGLQCEYLNNARNQQFLPRGIADQIKFTCAIHDPVLESICQSIMNFAGSRLLDLLIIYYSSWAKRIQASYYSKLYF